MMFVAVLTIRCLMFILNWSSASVICGIKYFIKQQQQQRDKAHWASSWQNFISIFWKSIYAKDCRKLNAEEGVGTFSLGWIKRFACYSRGGKGY